MTRLGTAGSSVNPYFSPGSAVKRREPGAPPSVASAPDAWASARSRPDAREAPSPKRPEPWASGSVGHGSVDRAEDAGRRERDPHLTVEVVGQAALDQPRAEPAPRRFADGRPVRLLPHQTQPLPGGRAAQRPLDPDLSDPVRQ